MQEALEVKAILLMPVLSHSAVRKQPPMRTAVRDGASHLAVVVVVVSYHLVLSRRLLFRDKSLGDGELRYASSPDRGW